MRGALARLARSLGLAEARCPGCGRPRAAGGPSVSLCPECLEAEGPEPGAACPGCGEYADAEGLCARCAREPRPWGRILVRGPYRGRLRELILAYKFEGRLDLGRELQELACQAFEAGLLADPGLAGVGLLAPVPLHNGRLFKRGFNQSLEIARLLAARRRIALAPEALARIRRTTPQMELDRGERARNIRGAFAARAGLVAGRHVLLVDDIMTTGATLEECARTLLASGAARVDVLVLARA